MRRTTLAGLVALPGIALALFVAFILSALRCFDVCPTPGSTADITARLLIGAFSVAGGLGLLGAILAFRANARGAAWTLAGSALVALAVAVYALARASTAYPSLLPVLFFGAASALAFSARPRAAAASP